MDATQEEIKAVEAADTSEYLLTTDGKNIELDIMHKMLNEQFKTYIPKNDPSLMSVSIHNALISSIVKVHNEHTKILEKVYTKQTEQQAKNVMEAANEIKKTLSALAVQGLKEVNTEMVKNRISSFYLTGINVLCTFLIVGAIITGLLMWRH